MCKWSYQIRGVDQIEEAINRAFEIACSGIPGPVLLDITKDAQTEETDYRGYREELFTESLYQKIFRYINELDSSFILSMDLKNGKDHLPFFHKKIEVLISEISGFALPAAIGASFAFPDTPLCIITFSEAFQHTMQELALVRQNNLRIRIILVYSTDSNGKRQKYPCFSALMEGYGIPGETNKNHNLREAIIRTLQSKTSYFLEIIPD